MSDNIRINKGRDHKEDLGCTKAEARSKTPPENDGNKTTQTLTEGNENVSKIIASGSKFGGEVSSDGELEGA